MVGFEFWFPKNKHVGYIGIMEEEMETTAH